MFLLTSLLLFVIVSKGNCFDWQDGSGGVKWALNCDFTGADIGDVRVPGEQCGQKCLENPSCNRFTWTNYEGGTCWLKSGATNGDGAVYKGNDAAVCGYRKQDGGGVGHPVDFVNGCPFTVWVGALSQHLPKNGGWRLNSGETSQVRLATGWQGRFWGRTDCEANGHCATGDCGRLECSGAGGVPPATLAEFKFDGWGGIDYYDVSLVDGYNLPISIAPNKRGGGGKYDCTKAGCNADLNAICPSELAVKRNDHTIACKSACAAFNTDAYCCRGAHNRPETCKFANWPVNYPAVFKRACPLAYSYAYDDTLSTFTCKSTDPTTGYTVKFCP